MSEAEVTPSGIAGYGKGKVPEKCVCINCLRKGVKCKWDKGGQGKSEKKICCLTLTQPPQENLMHARRFGALIGKEAMHRGGTDSEASEEAEVKAGGGCLGPKEAQSIFEGETQLLVLCSDGKSH